MELYRRPDSKFWWVNYSVPGQKSIRRSTKRINVSEAKLVAASWYKEAHDAAQLGIKPEITLADAYQRYIDTMRGTRSYAELCRYRDKLLGIGRWKGKVFHLPASMKMSELKTHTISQLRERRKAEGLAHNSVNLELKGLQRTWNLCRREWGFNVDPGLVFTMLKVKPKTRYLSKEEINAVLEWLDKPTMGYRRAYTLAVVLLDTGLRFSEALNLRWSQIEIESHRIRVYRQKTSSWSTVPLTDRVVAVLDQSKEQAKPFVNMARGVKLLRQAIDEVCNVDEYVLRSSGKATIHSLRDTYATRLVTSGMSLYQVSKLLGHTDIKMSSKYAHLEIDRVADEARQILER